MRTKKILGRDLKVGDEVAFLGQFKKVTGFEPHPGLDGRPARIAESEDEWTGNTWGMTVFDDDDLTIVDTTPDPQKAEFAAFLNSLMFGPGDEDKRAYEEVKARRELRKPNQRNVAMFKLVNAYGNEPWREDRGDWKFMGFVPSQELAQKNVESAAENGYLYDYIAW